ncbi:MAG: Ig-like domain-containing protein, partial [Micrococcales bacterium]|nr:Ig-like domain-containing protein [Micrococcales bacterium]
MTTWWTRRRTGNAAAATVPLLVGALVLAHQGFPVARLDLDDGGVWLTSRTDGALGRFNVPVAELDGGLGTSTTQFDVLQDGADVLLVDGTEVLVVDPASVATTTRASVEAGATVSMAGGTVMVSTNAGRIWVGGLDRLPDLGSGPADLDLGAGAKAVVAQSGTVLAVATNGEVITVARDGTTTKDGTIKNLGSLDQITAVGDEPVVLDGTTVRTRDGAVALAGSGLVLQQPGPSADAVLVSSSSALYQVPLTGGSPTTRTTSSGPVEAAAVAAAPVRVGGCMYAAWASATNNWMRICGSTVDTVDRTKVTAAADLRFRVNRSQVVLNDVETGQVWLADVPQAIEPAWSLINPRSKDDPETGDGEEPTVEHTTQCSEEGRAPMARDDEYGVRPGRATTLRVLANDTTSDCGILVISAVDELPPDFGTVRIVDAGRALEVDIAAGATGSASFTYTATDRPGLRAPATARVRLTVHDWSQNSPPVQVSTTTVRLGQGESLSVGVLSDFSDPDGDPLALVGASMSPAFGSVVFRPDGVVTVTASGQIGLTTVALKVTDGMSPPVDGVLEVAVREGATNPMVDPVHVVGYVDRPLVVEPLAAVRSAGAEPVRLAGVG